jgi:hypothetical protein
MTLRNIIGKVRRKILRILFGRNLYTNPEQLEYNRHLISQQTERINSLERLVGEQQSNIKNIERDLSKRESLYRLIKYAPEYKYPEILSDSYFSYTGEKLNLDNPCTFNEKIQWLKLYDSTPIKTRLSDKFLVRDWVKEKIGAAYLIPLPGGGGVYDSFDEINFAALPERFVLKTNHSSGWNIIVKDKAKLDINDARHKINYWMHTNYAYYNTLLELNYRDIKPKIIVEQYLENDISGEDLRDYKFLCFGGEPKYVWIDVDRYTNHKRYIYDLEWNQLPLSFNYPVGDKILSPPSNFNEMIRLARILCEGFCFTRVDLYSVCNKVYFGEMSFAIAAGVGKFEPEEWGIIWGNMIKLPVKNEK